PIKQKLSTGFQVESDQTDKKMWTATIRHQLLETQVNLQVNLGTSEITLDELMDLKIGDVIPLDQDSNGEFDVVVEGVPKFKSYYGIH
ncbi:FliM/FliN family flagellar motor switch protein, partial [Vibrio parahaemolyticus]